MGKVIPLHPTYPIVRPAGQAVAPTPEDVAASRDAWRVLAVIAAGIAVYEGVQLLKRPAKKKHRYSAPETWR